ncbi:MAG: hypothetical protein R8M38_00255 [Mariprofundaceae bacterium]
MMVADFYIKNRRLNIKKLSMIIAMFALLLSGANIAYSSDEALGKAAAEGDLASVKSNLNSGNINREINGMTPLSTAIFQGLFDRYEGVKSQHYVDVIQYLLDSGANPDNAYLGKGNQRINAFVALSVFYNLNEKDEKDYELMKKIYTSLKHHGAHLNQTSYNDFYNQMQSSRKKAFDAKVQVALRDLALHMEVYFSDHSRYPEKLSDLVDFTLESSVEIINFSSTDNNYFIKVRSKKHHDIVYQINSKNGEIIKL